MLNDFYHMLDPVAISAGPITIYWYGLAYVVGALLTAVVMCSCAACISSTHGLWQTLPS